MLGVGNILLSDDGVGVRALELLEESYSFSPQVTLLDGGTGGLTLVSALTGKTLVIILDAVSIEEGGGKAVSGSKAVPGSLVRIEGSRLEKALSVRSQLGSLHDIGMNEVLMISALEDKAPNVILIGMTPESIAPGTELSPVVREALSGMADMVVTELKHVGVKIRRQSKTV
ncbi:hypothetical protein MNBD_DELTA01-130 [hydrothermal vent metagenome]|uniref:Hydrogenase maturation protease n=1 Tax=hydrothermal vent metagenome TaxID=652676 RepID=A0A3B0RCL8_9ZZZZ